MLEKHIKGGVPKKGDIQSKSAKSGAPCTGLNWDLLDCTGQYWTVLGCTRLLSISPCQIGFHHLQ